MPWRPSSVLRPVSSSRSSGSTRRVSSGGRPGRHPGRCGWRPRAYPQRSYELGTTLRRCSTGPGRGALQMGRTLAASAIPALVISASWLRMQEPREMGEALVVVGLALLPALLPGRWPRGLAVAGASVGVLWIAFGAKSWELLPFRDERVVDPVVDDVSRGLGDYYGVVLPFDPTRHPEMHALLLVAIFGFVAVTALLIAARRPLIAAAVTVGAVGWPATLVSDGGV